MTYKDDIITVWAKAGGLIPKATAAKILGVNRSVMSKRKDVKTWIVGKDEFVSYTEIINREDIKPKKTNGNKS